MSSIRTKQNILPFTPTGDINDAQFMIFGNTSQNLRQLRSSKRPRGDAVECESGCLCGCGSGSVC
ncbi:unnamed protein product, partial [Rotaria sp. Silwood2]